MIRKIARRLHNKFFGFIRGEGIASEFGPSKITSYLYLGKQPKHHGDYGLLRDLNVGLIVNAAANCEPHLEKQDGSREESPIRTIWIKAYDDLFMPPISVEDIKYAVEQAQESARISKRIYAHCRAGRHRSVAVAGCILIAVSNLKAEGAMALIKFMRPEADPYYPPIHKVICEFEKYWSEKGGVKNG